MVLDDLYTIADIRLKDAYFQKIQELMEQFLHVPNDVDSQAALSDKVGYLGYRQEEQVLYLYFDAGYGSRANMNATREILCRAALTKTMTQVEGVDYISIYVADQPLLDQSGSPVAPTVNPNRAASVAAVRFPRLILIGRWFSHWLVYPRRRTRIPSPVSNR